MSKLEHPFLKQDKVITKAMSSQERWRQKQIDIYYRRGRPIFHISRDKLKQFA